MNPLVRLAAVIAGIASVTTAASAGYECTPKAIAAKNAFTRTAFNDFISGKYGAGKGDINAMIQKVWDGHGDCDPSGGDAAKLDPNTQAALMATHYYGDVMTVSLMVPKKDFKDARSYMDDFMAVHGLISGPFKAGFTSDFWKQDGGSNGIYSAMKSYDAEITKAGFKPTQ